MHCRLFAYLACLALSALPFPLEAAGGRLVASDAIQATAPDAAIAARLFDDPGATRITRLDDAPRGWSVDGPEGNLGFIASTWEIAGSIGYSGRPLDVLVALRPDGVIAGAELVRHNEPILTLGISEADIAAYVSAFAGHDITRPATEAFAADASLPPVIARATVSTGVIRDAILRTARAVALGRGLIAGAGDRVDRISFEPRNWPELVAEGAIKATRVTMRDAAEAFAEAKRPPTPGDGAFHEVWVALLDPPTIGRNLLGQQSYTASIGSLGVGDAAIFVGSRGVHSHRGVQWRRSKLFERIEIIQGERSFRLTADDYLRIDRIVAEGAPELKERSVFRLRADQGFRPGAPFRIEVTATRDTADGAPIALRIPVDYALPESFKTAPPTPPKVEPLWVSAWEAKRVEVASVGVMLLILLGLLTFQEPFVRRPKLWRAVRLGYLGVTVVWLGYALGGQLSVVQVVAFLQSLLNGFRWETFLIEPVIFTLWGFVGLGLLFLGRGVFCGWLCPFGALQELLNEAAQRLRVPQIEVPHAVQERLWAIKYLLFIAILALSFYSMEMALKLAEAEPFKTAVSLRFMRAWPFVAFAVGLLLAGLFIERFYCRFLCPLGAALAIPAKMKLFDWLHRRPQCGRECRKCAPLCTVGAIDPLGRINPNECVLCLRCQVIMNDETQCTVLKNRAARNARARA